MVVSVYQFLEQSKRAVSSLVWLHCLEHGNYSIRNFVITLGWIIQARHVVFEAVESSEQWEIRFVMAMRGSNEHPTCECACNLPHNIIQGTTQVVEAISDDRTESRSGMLSDVGLPADLLRVVVDGDRIRVRHFVFLDCCLETIQMFLSPGNFEPGSI